MKKIKKITSTLLCVILVSTCIPMTVFSNGTENISQIQDTEPHTEQTTEDYVLTDQAEVIHDEIIGNVAEIEYLREEKVKHFRLSNGTYQAVSYATPVHRQNSDGKWVDINNNLSLSLDKYTTPDSRVQFAEKYTPNSTLFTLSENGYTISMMHLVQNTDSGNLGQITETEIQPISARITNSPVDTRPKTFNSIDEALQIDNKSSVIYENIRANTDLEYVMQGNNIKENIILRGLSSGYDYVFRLDLQCLTAALTDNGEILLKDSESGDAKYIIPRPYMYDAGGTLSYEVKYTLQSAPGGKYLLAISASDEWIESSDREFPVTIDPTFSITCPDMIQDTFSHSGVPDVAFGQNYTMSIGQGTVAYIRFEIPSLPVGAVLQNGYMCVAYYCNPTSGGVTAALNKITEGWNEYTLTHNNSPSIEPTSFGLVTFAGTNNYTQNNPNIIDISLTSVLEDWFEDSSTNYGIALTPTSSINEYDTAYIYSHEASTMVIGDNIDYSMYTEFLIVGYSYQVPDGVYAFKLASYSHRWMTLTGSTQAPGGSFAINSKYDPTLPENFDRSSLFKISRVGNTDRYIIRSMLNNRLSPCVTSDNNVKSVIIPENDADVPIENTFYLIWTGDSCQICPYWISWAITAPMSGSQNLTTTQAVAANPNSMWTLSQYTGQHQSGLFGTRPASWNSVGHIVGTSGDVKYFSWSTYVGANTINAYVSTSENDMCNFYNLSNDQIMPTYTIYALNPGVIHVYTRIVNSSGNIVANTGSFAYRVVPQEGIYYIRNSGTLKYVDISNNSLYENTPLQQWGYVYMQSLKWNIEHVPNSNGYVRIKSERSGLYMRVDSNNTSLINQSSIQDDYSLWKIDRTSSGNLKFVCKALESSNGVLAVPLNATNADSLDLTQVQYADNTNYRDEWTLHRITNYVNLEVNYDNGYLIRYSDAYNKISREILSLQEKYAIEFGLEINVPSISKVYSLADLECDPNPLSVCNDCTDENDCYNSVLYTNGTIAPQDLHHKNNYNMLFNSPDISLPDTSNSFKIVYFGHDNCRVYRNDIDNSINHVENPVAGFCYPARGIIVNIDFYSEISSISTTVHEFGHIYGAPDHYDEPDVPSTDQINTEKNSALFSKYCIYGEYCYFDDVMENLIICDGCKAEIKSHISDYNH